MKNRMNIIFVRLVTSVAVVKNVDALAVEIYVPPTSSYAKLPRLPDGDEGLTIPGMWWR